MKKFLATFLLIIALVSTARAAEFEMVEYSAQVKLQWLAAAGIPEAQKFLKLIDRPVFFNADNLNDFERIQMANSLYQELNYAAEIEYVREKNYRNVFDLACSLSPRAMVLGDEGSKVIVGELQTVCLLGDWCVDEFGKKARKNVNYNAFWLQDKAGMTASADKFKGDTLTLGIGREGEPYEGIGRGMINIHGLPVYRDQEGGVGTPTSDNERTKMTLGTTHLLVLINDILFLSRLDAHMIEIKPQMTDFCTNFEMHCQTTIFRNQKPGIDYSIENPYERLVVEIDEQNLGIVIDQLLSHAAFFTTEGQVRIRCDYTGEDLIIALHADKGVVPEHILPHIFDRFIQTHRHGTGLELSICNELISQMGGKIRIKSNATTGTIVWMSVPCKCSELVRKQ